MDTNIIALTDLVKSLGYRSHTAVSNKIRDILKTKENFKSRFIIDVREEYATGRTEKVYVSKDAKVIVDNLAILLQYSGLFGRGEANILPAYKQLKNGVNEERFKSNVIKHSQTIKLNAARSKSCLKELPVFANAILNKGTVDITKQSLRELMQAQNINSEILDLGNTYELSAWNELLEHQNQLDQGESDSTLYQKVGENFFELGDTDQALTALTKSTELDPKNGISWAISSVILHSILRENKHSHYQALARNEFSESVANPITAEEHWINERIDDTYDDIMNVSSQFITSAIYALSFWPDWGMPLTFSKAKGKPNYFYKLNQSHDTDVEIEREYLFLKLINEINFNQFKQYKDEIIEIVRSFQMWNPSDYPQTKIMFDLNNTDKSNLIRILSWISDIDVKNALISYFDDSLKFPFRAQENLALLKDVAVQSLYWKHIGKTEYRNKLGVLLELDIKNKEIDNLNQLSSHHLVEVHSKLTAIKKKFNVEYQYGDSPPNCYLEYIQLSTDDVNLAFSEALIESEGWHENFSEQAWINNPYSIDIHWHFYSLMLISILLELIKNQNLERNIIYLQELCEHEHAMRSALSKIPSVFYSELVKRIEVDNMLEKNKNNLLLSLEIIFDLRNILDDEEAEYNYHFD